MKKIALSLAGVLAAAAFAPEASAVPVFARQTGMACSACHFQHFPLLNGFGRSFKAAGFSMVGAQGMVEGEHLSIPDRLNMAVFTTSYYQRESNAGATQAQWGVPASGGELSIFYGGRAGDWGGFLSELGAAGPAGTGAAKLALLPAVGDARVGAVLYTGGQGAAYSFELLNTGAADTHKMVGNSGPSAQHVAALYANSYLGTKVDATGVQLVANNAMGFVTAGQYVSAPPGTGTANELPLTYIRAAGMFDLAGWDAAAGVQNFSGNMGGYGSNVRYAATTVDFQMQGELAGMESGFYVTYGTAPADTHGNAFAAGNSMLVVHGGLSQVDLSASTLNASTSIEIIPHTATVQAGMRFATLKTTGGSYADNAIMVGATYEIQQNWALGVNYTMNSGSGWDTAKTNNGGVDVQGKTAATLIMEVLF